jgi:hypothetical protein
MLLHVSISDINQKDIDELVCSAKSCIYVVRPFPWRHGHDAEKDMCDVFCVGIGWPLLHTLTYLSPIEIVVKEVADIIVGICLDGHKRDHQLFEFEDTMVVPRLIKEEPLFFLDQSCVTELSSHH